MVGHWFGRRSQIDGISGEYIRMFSYASLQRATNDFSDNMLIGTGGSARIYKGLLRDGTVVAVKKYKDKCPLRWETNFLHIVEVMSRINHRNINKVIGCCVEKNHQLLVIEYAENRCLSCLLRNPEKKELLFKWHTRASVLMGIARGLSYLHEDVSPRIIHRDIKPSNILLDSNFIPKIADFDIAKFFSDYDELPLDAQLAGTFGYLDPECVHTDSITEKVDVYGFGVLMLEVISGRRPFMPMECDDDDRLISLWASKLAESGRVSEIVDPVMSHFPTDDVHPFIEVALLCTQLESKLRPTMHQVVLMLHGVCNSCKQALRKFDIPRKDDATHFSEVLSLASSTTAEDESTKLNEVIVPTISNALPCEGVEASGGQERTEEDHVVTGSTEEQNHIPTDPPVPHVLHGDGVEASRGQQHTNEGNLVSEIVQEGSQMTTNLEAGAHTPVQQQQQQKKKKCGVILSGSGDLVEKLSQTMPFKKYSDQVYMEAVYPPFLTREYPIRTPYRRQR